MGRVINTDSPGKRRNQQMRTSAELLRRLSQKRDIDDDAKNMLALLVFTLRDIADSIDDSTVAWEKRDYWIKAEEFRRKWSWTHKTAMTLEGLIANERWQDIPQTMIEIFPHFSDIKVNKLTRNSSLWEGCYGKLMDGQGN
jgi:hypothetical protein